MQPSRARSDRFDAFPPLPPFGSPVGAAFARTMQATGTTPLSESDRLWERRLRKAVGEGSIQLATQPILNLHTHRICRYRLVPRLTEADGSTTELEEGLPAADRLGLLAAVHREVLQGAIQIIARYRAEGLDLSLEVPLGEKAPSDSELSGWLHRKISLAGIKSSCLVLQLRERAIGSAGAEGTRFIREVRGLGCKFALNEFGMVGWSFYSLEHSPVDFVRVVAGTIHRLPHSKPDQDLVRRLVKVADRSGTRVVATGVDNRELVHLARQYGMDEAEGNSIGQPGTWHMA